MKSEKKKKIKKLRSLNNVLWTYIAVFALFLIIALETASIMTVRIMLEREARGRLVSIGGNVTEITLHSQPEFLGNYFSDFREEGYSVYLISADGAVILPADEAGRDFSSLARLVTERLEGKKAGEDVMMQDESHMTYASVIEQDSQFILVRYSLSFMKHTMTNMIIYFVVVGITSLLMCVFVGYNISQKLSNGLKTLSTAAGRLTKGDFNVDFANAEYREIAELSASLNLARDEIKKSADFQRELLANVTHDLKTPLTMIKAYASMIKEISGDNPEKRDMHLQVIIDEADRLTGLVNDVLAVSKVSSNLDEMNLKVFNLTEFVYGVINKFGYLQESQGYNIMVDVDPNLYTRADEEKIGQVLYNLIGNAVNYTGDDKTIYISLKKPVGEDRIKFSVRDTGKGIPEDQIGEIWNRFYRVKETHTRPVKGTGLGLSIVKIILENHKFDFGVTSEVGVGSTFFVDFPSVEEE